MTHTAEIFREFTFESAHKLPNVAPGQPTSGYRPGRSFSPGGETRVTVHCGDPNDGGVRPEVSRTPKITRSPAVLRKNCASAAVIVCVWPLASSRTVSRASPSTRCLMYVRPNAIGSLC